MAELEESQILTYNIYNGDNYPWSGIQQPSAGSGQNTHYTNYLNYTIADLNCKTGRLPIKMLWLTRFITVSNGNKTVL